MPSVSSPKSESSCFASSVPTSLREMVRRPAPTFDGSCVIALPAVVRDTASFKSLFAVTNALAESFRAVAKPSVLIL